MTYWVTLKEPVKYRGAMRQGFSVDGEDTAQAATNAQREFALAGLKIDEAVIVDLQPLPYPGEPRLGYKGAATVRRSVCTPPSAPAGTAARVTSPVRSRAP